MKKLIVAMFAVASAIAVQAASISWGADAVEYTDEVGLDAGTYWLVNLGASTDVSGFKVYSDGTYDFGTGVVVETGSIVDPYGVAGERTGATPADNGSYYTLVVWDGAADGKYGVADAVAVAGIAIDPPTDADYLSFGNGTDSYGSALFANQDVVSQAIPEPTSGLLMLLGMAGLALRRRRA